MKAVNLLLTIGFVLTSLGCKEIRTKDGSLPERYIPLASQLEGTYQGYFAGREGHLAVSFEGNKPRIEFQSASGDDLVGVECKSRIGQLKSFQAVKKGQNRLGLKMAEFAFDPNLCANRIAGRSLVLFFSETDENAAIQAFVVEKTFRFPDPLSMNCEPVSAWCLQRPRRDEVRHVYLQGLFYSGSTMTITLDPETSQMIPASE